MTVIFQVKKDYSFILFTEGGNVFRRSVVAFFTGGWYQFTPTLKYIDDYGYSDLVEGLQRLSSHTGELRPLQIMDEFDMVFGEIFFNEPAAFSKYYYPSYYENNNSKFGRIMREIADSCSQKQSLCSVTTFVFLSEIIIFNTAVCMLHNIVGSDYIIDQLEWHQADGDYDWPFPGKFFNWDQTIPFNVDYDYEEWIERNMIFWARVLYPNVELEEIREEQSSAGIYGFKEPYEELVYFNFTQERMTGNDVLLALDDQYRTLSDEIKNILNKRLVEYYESFSLFFTVIAVDRYFEEADHKNDPNHKTEFDILPYSDLDNLGEEKLKEMEEWFKGICIYESRIW